LKNQMNLPSLKSADVKNKTVMVRADLDVPVKKNEMGEKRVSDTFRLEKMLSTVKWLMDKDAKIILIGHLKRPQSWDKKYSLQPVAKKISDLLGLKFIVIDEESKKLPHYPLPHVFFFKQDFRKIKHLLSELNPKDIAILENIRFYPEEEKTSEKFAEELSSIAEIYVNESFATDYHDNQVSIVKIPEHLPSFAGLLLEKEIKVLTKVLERPKKPYVLMIGGIKLSEKFEGLKGILDRCDYALLGGGIATLFFASRGYEVGTSVMEKSKVTDAKEFLRNYKEKIILPDDLVVASSPVAHESITVVSPDNVNPEQMILDVGPETIGKYSEYIKSAKTLLWSGPMGLFENPHFAHGTKALGRLFASRSSGAAYGVAGGGDTLDAIKMINVGEYIDHLSVGGSAMLQFLAGKPLPGIEALKK